jgi:hypothetical protein
MKHSVRLLAVSSIAAITIAAAASCSNSTSNNGLTPQEMQGNYVLTSVHSPPAPVLVPPAATGTLALTLTNYTLVLTITGSGTQYDGGTYTISGNNFTQHSDTTGFSYDGTATLVADSLNVLVVTPGGNVTTTWHKQ